MSKKKNYEYQENRYSRDSDGLRQRRLKEESRWRFNPNSNYSEEDDDLPEQDEIQEDDYR